MDTASTEQANTDDTPGDKPFEGVRIVELAQWVFVPAAGAFLADWGADVVRIERLDGDPYRGLATQGIGADSGGVNMSMALVNRGKRSIALDLQTEGGITVLHKLLATADVFLTNLRPGALRRLGLDSDQLMAQYPALVYARGHGFGAHGPDADMPGYDATAFWARGGMAHMLTPTDRSDPIGQRGAMGDRNAGMALAFGMSAALLKKYRTGQGSVVDVSLLAAAMLTLSSDILTALQGIEPPRVGAGGGGPNPLVSIYRTSDARHVQLVFLQPDRYWPALCKALGRSDLATDERFVDIKARATNGDACRAELDREFGSRTLEECNAVLSTLDAPWAPVQSLSELLNDPQVVANEYIAEVSADGYPSYRLPNVPVQFDGRAADLQRAPEHGEHTELVLLELGYEWEQIAELQALSVIP